ncbi:hypothetical protein ABPG75_006435 [Micractinium tetrahymenae]
MLPPLLRALLNLPAYLAGVSVLFWCFQGAALTGFLKWWRLSGPRSDVQAVLDYLKAAFRYRALKLPGPDIAEGKVVYLFNHRGWGDFFIDMWVSGARARPLSRRAVGMAFPAFTSSLMSIKSILLFNRAGVKDTEKFNRWLDTELAEGPQNSLLVYPEGTRSQKAQSLPLKRGMLRYAFSRKLPVQVVITAGKEEVLNERRRWAHLGRTLVTGCSEVLESAQFEDFEEFAGAVQRLWDEQWERVHAAPRSGFPPLVPRFPELRYSAAILASESAALALWTAVLAALTYGGVRLLARLAVAGPAGRIAVVALALWTAASLAAAALLPPPKSRGAGAKAASSAAGEAQGAGRAATVAALPKQD